MRTSRRLSHLGYLPLLSSGVVVFLGIVMLGGAIGLLWHPFKTWVVLHPYLIGSTEDWIVWAGSFVISASPGFALILSRKREMDLTLASTHFLLPILSLAMITQSYPVGATALIGSGFLLSYVLVNDSDRILRIEKGTALRIVASEVFTFLAIISAGGIISLLVWQDHFLPVLISGSYLSPSDQWLHMLGIDIEVFYLVRPVLSAALVTLGLVALFALFKEPLGSLGRLLLGNRFGSLSRVENVTDAKPDRAPFVNNHRHSWLPYTVLLGSIALGVVLTLFPYFSPTNMVLFGSDSWFYIDRMRFFTDIGQAIRGMESDRGLFVLLLIAVKIFTGVSPESIVRATPPFLSALLALSTFLLVKEGTSRPWLASFAALLSVISAQTTLAMAAGILANWFGLAVASLVFALVVRAVRLRSLLAFLGALVFSVILIGSYSYIWVTAMVALCLATISSVLAFRSLSNREWIRETGISTIVFVGAMFAPVVAVYLVSKMGVWSAALDPSLWLQVGWNYLQGQVRTGAIASAFDALEQAFDFAGNRVDLPFLTLLSVIGLFDTKMLDRSFRRIVAGMVVASLAFTILSPDIYLTWRGLFILPLYLTGALGAGSVINRVNQVGSLSDRRMRLVFAGTFSAYLFLSLLSYSLRAMELLVWESHF